MASPINKGVLIAVEGIDGSGKTTLCHNLAKQLTSAHYQVLLTKEPGGSPLGTTLRTLLQHQEIPLDAKAEFLLFAADRAQHFQEIIIPALQKNNIVISDRLADSSLAYQGFGRGLDLQLLTTINNWAMQNIMPDITLYVKVDIETAMVRLQKSRSQLTSFEKKTFLARVLQGFDQIFANRTDVIILDGTQAPEILTNQACQLIINRFRI